MRAKYARLFISDLNSASRVSEACIVCYLPANASDVVLNNVILVHIGCDILNFMIDKQTDNATCLISKRS